MKDDMPIRLDWSHAPTGDPAPCVLCGRPAIMRSPERGVPCHKTCAETWHTERSFKTESPTFEEPS